jgi:glycosyltransferase involved in cell wall biosynthesis
MLVCTQRFGPERVPDQPQFAGRAAATPSGPPAETARADISDSSTTVLVIDYNVGDGGGAYEAMASQCLTTEFSLVKHSLDFRRWGALKYVAAPLEFGRINRLLRSLPGDSVVVKTFSAALVNPRNQPPNIVIVHHVDGNSTNWLYAACEHRLISRLKHATAVVVVSEYWKRRLALSLEVKNIHVIHNGFRTEEFSVLPHERDTFKSRYGLLGKPIVYLGAYQADKGVIEAAEALKDVDAHLVSSSHFNNGLPPGRLRCLHLGRRDYIRLLASSTVAIAMSQFAEGWCRSAHEAMLCGTPVVGSGYGGLSELLEGGRQIICPDFGSLRSVIEDLLHDAGKRAELGTRGREFARLFTYERFRSEWIHLVQNVRCQRTQPLSSNYDSGSSEVGYQTA